MAISFISPTLYWALNIAICQLYPGVKTFTFLYGNKFHTKEEGDSRNVHPAIFAHHILYWGIYLVYSHIESSILSHFIHLIPFFYETKLLLFYWLVSDSFKGAGYLFNTYGVKRVLKAKSFLVKRIEADYDAKTRAKVADFLNKLFGTDDVEA